MFRLRVLALGLLLACSSVWSADRVTSNGMWLRIDGVFYGPGYAVVDLNDTQYFERVMMNSQGLTVAGVFGYAHSSLQLRGTNNVLYRAYPSGTQTQSPAGDYSAYRAFHAVSLLTITNFTEGDRDGDGVLNDSDEDPDDPDKKRPDRDKDGISDDTDCDPDDATNKGVKPNCYKCDGDTYAVDAGSCPPSDGNYDDADSNEPDWAKIRADLKIYLSRLGINFDQLKGMQKKSFPITIRYPTWSMEMTAAEFQWGEYQFDANPEEWQDDNILKPILLKYQPWVITFFKFLFAAFFIAKIATMSLGR